VAEHNVQEYIYHGKAQMLPFVKIEYVSQNYCFNAPEYEEHIHEEACQVLFSFRRDSHIILLPLTIL